MRSAAPATRPASAPLVPASSWLIFAGWIGAAAVLHLVPVVQHGFIQPWTQWNSALAAWGLRLFGLDAGVAGRLLYLETGSVDVRTGCNGIVALLILSAAMVAFPVAWRRRVIGVALGAVGIFGLNAFRLATLVWIVLHFPSQAELFHIQVWQTVIALLSFVLFMVWGHFALGLEVSPSPARPRAACRERMKR